MFQAWGSLGYAYRVTGNYPASLEAYAKALEIQPAYTPAIEYRAEAYLGLGRLDEVKSAYMTLFNSDRKRADELDERDRPMAREEERRPFRDRPRQARRIRQVGVREEAARRADVLIDLGAGAPLVARPFSSSPG